jgi:hypothetical protein
VAADHRLDTGVEERVEDTIDFRARYSEHMLYALSFKIGDEDLCTTSAHGSSPSYFPCSSISVSKGVKHHRTKVFIRVVDPAKMVHPYVAGQ